MAILRVSVMRLVVAAMAVAAGVLFFSGAGEARVLLTLDDFGAVGDGIANDTQVRCSSSVQFFFILVGENSGTTVHSVCSCLGLLGRLERRLRLDGAGRPRRAGGEDVPDLAGAARRALQEEAQAHGTYVLAPCRAARRRRRRRSSVRFDGASCIVFVTDFRDDRGAGEPRRVGGARPDEVALRLPRRRPVRLRRRHHRRHGRRVVGALLQAQEDQGNNNNQFAIVNHQSII